VADSVVLNIQKGAYSTRRRALAQSIRLFRGVNLFKRADLGDYKLPNVLLNLAYRAYPRATF